MFTHRRTAQGSLYQAEARLSCSLSLSHSLSLHPADTPVQSSPQLPRWTGSDRKSIGEPIRNTRRLPRAHSPSQICSIVCVKLWVFLIKRNGTERDGCGTANVAISAMINLSQSHRRRGRDWIETRVGRIDTFATGPARDSTRVRAIIDQSAALAASSRQRHFRFRRSRLIPHESPAMHASRLPPCSVSREY